MTKLNVVIATAALGAALGAWTTGTAWAEEAAPEEAAPAAEVTSTAAEAPDTEAAPAEEPPPEAAAGSAAAGTPATGSGRAVEPRLERLGRVASVLLENEDAESAIEFGQEVLEEHGEDAELRLLLGACNVRLARYAAAVPHFERAVALSDGDAAAHLHALFNLARAQRLAGQLGPAAETYGRYVTYANAHEGVDNFVAEAERLGAVCRGRAAAAEASSSRRRPRRRR